MAYYFDQLKERLFLYLKKKPPIGHLLFMAARPGAALFILALSLLSCSEAVGGVYYVDPDSGNDSYDGRSAVYEGDNTGPWKSIARVNEQSFLPGDSILFKRGGVWDDGPLEPRNGGGPGGVVTIEDTVIDQPITFDLVDPQDHNCVYFGAYGEHPQKPRINCHGGRGIVLLHNYIIVEDLHIDNGGNNMLWLGRENGNSWIIIDSVEVTNCSANAVRSSYGGGNLWLKGLYVYNYGVNGILLNGSVNNKLRGVLVEDCWIENPEVLELEDAITCHRDSDENDMAGDVIIRNNTTLRAGEDGIDITTGSNILLEGNTTKFSHAGGIYVNYEWVNTVEVRGNFIYGNSISQGYGDLTIRSPRVRVVNNIVAGPGHHSVLVGSTDETQFWNNVIAPGNRTGNLIWFREGIGRLEFKNNIFDFSGTEQDISGDFPDSVVFDHNCYYASSRGREIYDSLSFQALREARPGFEPNGMWADPRFIHPAKREAGHFKISLNSACRDAGVSLPVAADLWGTLRPEGNTIDIGAHEVAIKAPYDPSWAEGRAWHDQNGNCARDAGEPALAKLAVDLYDDKGQFVAMAYTRSDGSFRFDNLAPGTYHFAASAVNFGPGQAFEHLSSTCDPAARGIHRRITVDPDHPAPEQLLGLATAATPSIELADFTVEKNGPEQVQLVWTTSREQGIDYFEIERSDNGREFFARGQSKSQGNTNGNNQTYRFTDEEPPCRLTYYRLKQVEKNGRYSYSGWKLVNMEKPPGAIKVFPNPFSDVLNVSLEQDATADRLWVIDAGGNQLMKRNIQDEGAEFSIDLSALPKGSYYLILRFGKKHRVKTAIPVVKQ